MLRMSGGGWSACIGRRTVDLVLCGVVAMHGRICRRQWWCQLPQGHVEWRAVCCVCETHRHSASSLLQSKATRSNRWRWRRRPIERGTFYIAPLGCGIFHATFFFFFKKAKLCYAYEYRIPIKCKFHEHIEQFMNMRLSHGPCSRY